MDMYQNDQSSSLIHFFKDYKFPDNLQSFHKSQTTSSWSQNILIENFQKCKKIVKQLQTSLQVSVISACKLIDIFKLQEQHKNSQYQFLNLEYQDLKQTILEDKKQNQRFLEESREIIEQLKKQLFQKQMEYRQICDRLQEKQMSFYTLKKDQKNINDKNQQIIGSYKQLQKQYLSNHEKLEQITSRLEQCQTELQKEEEINQKIYAQNHYLKTINQELLKKIQKLTNNQVTIKELQNQSVQIFAGQIDLNDESSLQKSQDDQNQHIFQLQDMNSSLQNPNVLKDVLNSSQQNIKFLNMTRQFLRSKEKQNWGQNFALNRTHSSKNEEIYLQEHFTNEKEKRKSFNEEEPKVLNSIQHLKINKKTFRQVKQFSMNQPISEQHLKIDPYFAFFTLTTQCVKINSKCFEQVAQLNLDGQWKILIQKRIPLNEWQQYIKNVIQKKSGLEI